MGLFRRRQARCTAELVFDPSTTSARCELGGGHDGTHHSLGYCWDQEGLLHPPMRISSQSPPDFSRWEDFLNP